MSLKYLILFFSVALVACSNVSEPKKEVDTVTVQTEKKVVPENTQSNGNDACELLHALKPGELARDRDARVMLSKRMLNNETDLIAGTLYPAIAATGRNPAKPISAVQKNTEAMCRTFASNMEKGQSWIGASAACLYPSCVSIATKKLKAKMSAN